MGGEGGGTNPEQLFAVGYAACFESALGAVARRRRLEVADVAIDSSVMLMPTESRGYGSGDARRHAAVDRRSGRGRGAGAGGAPVCPYSNATRGNVDVALTANGHAVEPAEPMAA